MTCNYFYIQECKKFAKYLRYNFKNFGQESQIKYD